MTGSNHYQYEAAKYAVYPEKDTGSTAALSYCALGLVGEAGEVADKIKKVLRGDKTMDEASEAVMLEIGDVLWYASRLAAELGYDLSDVLHRNLHKLQQRKVKDTIQGDGDDR